MTDSTNAPITRDVFGNAVTAKDREALPERWFDREGVERLTIHANHPLCRMLGAPGQWSIFDVLRIVGASPRLWRDFARHEHWRRWLRFKAVDARVPVWRVLADAGCPEDVALEVAVEERRMGFASGEPEAEVAS